MTLEEQLKFCSICENRKMNREIGLVCKLTDQKPAFIDNCPDFIKDEKESQRKLQLELNAAGDVETSISSSPSRIINSGIVILVIGTLVSFSGFVIAYGAVAVGILLIIKGTRQKEILEKNKKFEDHLKNNSNKTAH